MKRIKVSIFDKIDNMQKERNRTTFVYEIYWPETDTYYVGMSTDPERRLQAHCENKSGSIFRKMKMHYRFSVLMKLPTLLWGAAAEIELISLYKCQGKKLYNKTPGGDYSWQTKYETEEVKRMLGKLPWPDGEQFISTKKQKKLEKRLTKVRRNKAQKLYWKQKNQRALSFGPKSNEEWRNILGG